MLLGAGTVLTKEQVEEAIACGARYIVGPGFDEQIVAYCLDKGYPVMPGVSSPSEIQRAVAMGLKTLKLFPAEATGGTDVLKLYSGAFSDVGFVATGGITRENLRRYLSMPCVAACGGSWMAPKDAIRAKDFEVIEKNVRDSLLDILGFSIAHVGMNNTGSDEALKTAQLLARTFGQPVIPHNSCYFAGSLFEVLKSRGRGEQGHIAIGTRDIHRAIRFVESNGIELDYDSVRYFPDGRLQCIFFKQEFSGFALHLLAT